MAIGAAAISAACGGGGAQIDFSQREEATATGSPADPVPSVIRLAIAQRLILTRSHQSVRDVRENTTANNCITPQTVGVTNVTICYQEGIKSVVQLTRKADYGLRLMLEAAAVGDAFVTTRTVSRRQKIPYPFLRQAATVLAATGLLTTSRGAQGGVRLARPASDISILDIANAFGGLSLNDCTAVPARCARTNVCPAFPAWVQAQTAVHRALAGTNLDGLLRARKPGHGTMAPPTEPHLPGGSRRSGAA